MISLGLASHNFKFQVASDINVEYNQCLPEPNIYSQKYLDKLSIWTQENLMKLKAYKSKYMVVNFTDNFKFKTRMSSERNTLEEVNETRLLGVVINNKLTTDC